MSTHTESYKQDVLRFTTAGSVDDGKSTLIGRLLYDSKVIYRDQFESIKKIAERKGDTIDLSLLTDGLKAEREQGITIDVAYRYFTTPKRSFILADTPGHIQYTRNMVTGASNANAALILIDARNGILEQTRRHTILASLLQIKHLIVCVNKMDLVDFDSEVFESIKEAYEVMAAKLEIRDIEFIPISALHGDNVVNKSDRMPWYNGPSLMYQLENLHIASDQNLIDVRFPVQYVIRGKQEGYRDFRGLAGKMASGTIRIGDEVVVLPSGQTSNVKSIIGPNGNIDEAYALQSISLTLEDDLDISRGNMIVRPHNRPNVIQEIDLMICWFDETRILKQGNKYAIQHTTSKSRCIIDLIRYRLNIETLHRDQECPEIKVNDIARIRIKAMKPLFVDAYSRNKATGSIILIDESSNNTVAAGMIL